MDPKTPTGGDGPPPDVLQMGERIRARRDHLGLTGVELARQVGISSSYLSLIENRNRIPSEAVAARLADALEDDPDLYLAWSRLRTVDDLDEHLRRMTRLQEFTTDPRARRRMESGAALEADVADRDDDAHPIDLVDVEDEDVDDHVVRMRDRPRRRRSDRVDDRDDEEDLPTTLETILHEHYGDEDSERDDARRGPRPPRGRRPAIESVRDRIRRRRDGADVRPFPLRDRRDEPPTTIREHLEPDTAHGPAPLLPVASDTRAVPVYRDGDDPADDPEPLEVLNVDARLLPPDVDRPFAYRPDLRAVHRVRDLVHPGDLLVLTRGPAGFHRRRIHAVRFRGRVVLTRAARKGDMLALLPPPGQPGGFEVLRLRETTTTAGRGEALAEVVAGTVVATLRWWGHRGAATGTPTPRADAEQRDRTPSDRPHVRPRSRTRARFADDGALEIESTWHPKYGWRVVHARADLEAVLRAEREATEAGEDAGAAGRVRFVLVRDGERRHVVEMTGTQWREALGDAVTRPGWKRLGQAILSMTRTLKGEATETFLDRWAPYVREP